MSLTEERETLLRPNRKHEIRIITLFWQFVEFSLLWRFLTLCEFVQVACQGFLVREACVDVLVGGAVFLLSPFKDLGCFSGCLMSSASIQKLFCGIYSAFKYSFDEFVGEKVFSPPYSSAILAPLSVTEFFKRHQKRHNT